MKIHKYEGETVNEVMGRIKQELGSDALIIDKREVLQHGFWNQVMRRKKIEILVGLEEMTVKVASRPSTQLTGQPNLQRVVQQALAQTQAPVQKVVSPSSALVDTKPSIKTESEKQDRPIEAPVVEDTSISLTYGKVQKSNTKSESVPSQADQLKEMVQNQTSLMTPNKEVDDLKDEMKFIRQMLTKMVLEPQTSRVSGSEDPYAVILEQLFEEFNFSNKLQVAFREFLERQTILPSEVGKKHLHQFVQEALTECVEIREPGEADIRIFVGPPGVGKTTTIAKIASYESLINDKSVGLITVDTYRIGAVDQFRIYSNLLNAPLRVVSRAEEMLTAVDELRAEGCELIIVDSMGRSPRDEGNLNDLKALLDPLKSEDIYLVLNMTTKQRELNAILNGFKLLNYKQLVFTKLDEAEKNENILNLLYEHRVPVSYLCMGQEVPGDIENPTIERMLEFIWGGDSIE